MPPAIIGGAIAGIGAIGSAVVGSSAAKKAANAQQQAADAAIAENRRQYDLNREDLAPWRNAGASAIGSLSEMLQPGYDHTTSPGYQFRFNEGRRALEGSAASKGMLLSGGTLKDLTRFGQGIAAQDFNDQFNRTASVAQGGQQVAQNLASLGSQNASNIGSLLTQQGNARASGYVGSANAISGGLSNLGTLGMFAGMGGFKSPSFNPYANGYEFGPNG